MNTRQFSDKYEASGKIGQFLVDRFFQAAYELVEPCLAHSERVLEVGCGPGYSSRRVSEWAPDSFFVASDIDAELLRLTSQRNPGLPLLQQSVYSLAHPDSAFDLVLMLEVLEHLENPQKALEELRRVSNGFVLLSTPREPIWCLLNMCRGKYWKDFGNTPGHIQHWSTRGLIGQVSPYFEIVGVRQPLPWTMLLLRPK